MELAKGTRIVVVKTITRDGFCPIPPNVIGKVTLVLDPTVTDLCLVNFRGYGERWLTAKLIGKKCRRLVKGNKKGRK